MRRRKKTNITPEMLAAYQFVTNTYPVDPRSLNPGGQTVALISVFAGGRPTTAICLVERRDGDGVHIRPLFLWCDEQVLATLGGPAGEGITRTADCPSLPPPGALAPGGFAVTACRVCRLPSVMWCATCDVPVCAACDCPQCGSPI